MRESFSSRHQTNSLIHFSFRIFILVNTVEWICGFKFKTSISLKIFYVLSRFWLLLILGIYVCTLTKKINASICKIYPRYKVSRSVYTRNAYIIIVGVFCSFHSHHVKFNAIHIQINKLITVWYINNITFNSEQCTVHLYRLNKCTRIIVINCLLSTIRSINGTSWYVWHRLPPSIKNLSTGGLVFTLLWPVSQAAVAVDKVGQCTRAVLNVVLVQHEAVCSGLSGPGLTSHHRSRLHRLR